MRDRADREYNIVDKIINEIRKLYFACKNMSEKLQRLPQRKMKEEKKKLRLRSL